jgi:hypothetical protein
MATGGLSGWAYPFELDKETLQTVPLDLLGEGTSAA